jgi:anti-sigma factor RsiW
MRDQWTDRLSEYLDGELPPGERETVASHLAACGECRRTLSELRLVAAAAQRLTARPPAGDLWAGIAGRIAAAEPAEGTGAEPARPRSRRISFTLPELVAASLLIAAASAGVAWQFRSVPAAPFAAAGPGANGSAADAALVGPVSLADEEYDAAVGELERALQDGRALLDPTTIAIVEQNLAVINVAIEQARQALETDPANGYLSSHLLQARRKKLELLRRAAALAADAGSAQS